MYFITSSVPHQYLVSTSSAPHQCTASPHQYLISSLSVCFITSSVPHQRLICASSAYYHFQVTLTTCTAAHGRHGRERSALVYLPAQEASAPANAQQRLVAAGLIDALRNEGTRQHSVVDATRLLFDFYLQVPPGRAAEPSFRKARCLLLMRYSVVTASAAASVRVDAFACCCPYSGARPVTAIVSGIAFAIAGKAHRSRSHSE